MNKSMKWLGCVLFVSLFSVLQVQVSFASEEIDNVVRLAKNGISETVLLAYVETSDVAFDLSTDDILRLNDVGVSSKVIAAMLRKGKVVRDREKKNDPVAEEPKEVSSDLDRDPRPQPESTRKSSNRFESSLDQDEVENYKNENEKPIYSYRDPAPQVVQRYDAPEPIDVVYAPPSSGLNISFFYDALTPYGTWLRDPVSGWVWQPHAARLNRSWRPYLHNGHWIWSDYGWYWQSSYRWGWGPFHYGRWSRSINGWVWAPGNQWGPAWVHWRESPTYYGWAPLPPGAIYRRRARTVQAGFYYHGKRVTIGFSFGLTRDDYSFVPCGNFMDRDVSTIHHRHHGLHGHDIYRHTAVTNNTYIYNDNRVIHRGVARDKVQKHTHKKINRVVVSDRTVAEGSPLVQNEVKDGTLITYRPTIENKVTETPDKVLVRWQKRLERRKALQAKKKENREREAVRAAAKKEHRQEVRTTKEVQKLQKKVASDAAKAAKQERELKEEQAEVIQQAAKAAQKKARQAAELKATMEKRAVKQKEKHAKKRAEELRKQQKQAQEEAKRNNRQAAQAVAKQLKAQEEARKKALKQQKKQAELDAAKRRAEEAARKKALKKSQKNKSSSARPTPGVQPLARPVVRGHPVPANAGNGQALQPVKRPTLKERRAANKVRRKAEQQAKKEARAEATSKK